MMGFLLRIGSNCHNLTQSLVGILTTRALQKGRAQTMQRSESITSGTSIL